MSINENFNTFKTLSQKSIKNLQRKNVAENTIEVKLYKVHEKSYIEHLTKEYTVDHSWTTFKKY